MAKFECNLNIACVIMSYINILLRVVYYAAIKCSMLMGIFSGPTKYLSIGMTQLYTFWEHYCINICFLIDEEWTKTRRSYHNFSWLNNDEPSEPRLSVLSVVVIVLIPDIIALIADVIVIQGVKRKSYGLVGTYTFLMAISMFYNIGLQLVFVTYTGFVFVIEILIKGMLISDARKGRKIV